MVIIKKTPLGLSQNVAPWMEKELVLAESRKEYKGWSIPWPGSWMGRTWDTNTDTWEEVPPFMVEDYKRTPIHCPTRALAYQVAKITEGTPFYNESAVMRDGEDFCLLIGGNFSERRWFEENMERKKFKPVVEASYFILHHKLTQEMNEINGGGQAERPIQTGVVNTSKVADLTSFVIKGKPSLIKAIWEDLEGLGYRLMNNVIPFDASVIGINVGGKGPTSLKGAEELYASNDPILYTGSPILHLPQDYVRAVTLASEQIAAARVKNFNPEPKILTLSLGIPKRQIIIKSDGSGTVSVDDGYRYSVKRIKELIGPMQAVSMQDFEPADGVVSRALKWQKVWIGCEDGSEFHISELQEIVTAYENLQKGL